jgi:hypothetical protein
MFLFMGVLTIVPFASAETKRREKERREEEEREEEERVKGRDEEGRSVRREGEEVSVCSKASQHYSSYTGVRGRTISVGITGDEVVEYSNGSLVDVLIHPSGGLTG